MAATPSTMAPLGMDAPDFSLPDAHGDFHSLMDFAGAPALLVAFICSHCPFVIHIRKEFAAFAEEYAEKGLATVAIVSNDLDIYPQDGPDGMLQEAEDAGYTFPYLMDETQDVAKAYKAACTPDFFLFDLDLKLVYRGQFDGSRPESGIPVTGKDMRVAVDAVLAGEDVPKEQRSSIGCNIKWKAGNEPEYFGK